MEFLKRLLSTSRQRGRTLWDRVYRRVPRPTMSARLRRGLKVAKVLALALAVGLVFAFAFFLPAVASNHPGLVLTGGLVDGRWVAGLTAVALAAAVGRYGFPTSGNVRPAGRSALLALPLALLKTAGAGVAVGGIALISQGPTQMAGYVIPDDYDINGEPHRMRYVDAYLKQIEKMKDLGLAVNVAYAGESRPGERTVEPATAFADVIGRAEREGGTNPDLADAVMRQLKRLSEVSTVEDRLQQLRTRLKDQQGNRVVVVSAHRLPPATDVMRACWPLPDSISAKWVCANPTASDTSAAVKEPRVLSVWVSNDALVEPTARVSAENPANAPTCKLTWKMFATADTTAKPVEEKTFPPPTATAKEYQIGSSPQSGGVRFAWQFPLPRFKEPRFMTVDLEAAPATASTHPWRVPFRLAPNQIRVRVKAPEVSALLDRLPDLKPPAAPLLIDPTAVPPTPGCVDAVAAVPPDRIQKAPSIARDTPTLELLDLAAAGTAAKGRLHVTRSFFDSDLGEVEPAPAHVDDWPDVSVDKLEGAEVFAFVELTRGIYPVVFRRRPDDYPGWVTVVVPRGEMSKNAALGLRHLVIFAASLAERCGKGRPAWEQPYLLPAEAGLLPFETGRVPKKASLLRQFAAALSGGGMETEIRATPANSVAGRVAPAVPLGFALAVAISAGLTLWVVVQVRRRPTG